MERCDWADLPEAVRREVGKRCGPIGAVEPVAAGMNNALACVLHTGEGALFLKGIPANAPQAWMFCNELAAAGLGAPGPQLHWSLEVEGWTLLCWDHIPARHADLAPGSPDLDLIAAAIRDLADLPPLDPTAPFATEAQRWERMRPWNRIADDPPADLDPWVKANLTAFAAAEYDALQVMAGNRLVHTDIHEYNVLIRDQTPEAYLIDWAWARPGAPWIDAELLAFRLVAAGHTCTAADHWRLKHLPHPHLAPEIRRAFAIEMLGTWFQLTVLKPQRNLFTQMSDHALEWAKYLSAAG